MDEYKETKHTDETNHEEEPNSPFHDIIDDDLYEEFTDEEIIELVEEARIKALQKAEDEKSKKVKSRFPKWILWIIAIVLFVQVSALIPQTYSLPAVQFLSTSAALSKQENIQLYKKAVVVVETEASKGTGFSFTASGTILTNYHVVEDKEEVGVIFPEAGMYVADVIETYPDIDLAVLQIKDEQNSLPFLTLGKQFRLKQGESVYFIGNPLKFTGIANKGHIIDYTNVTSKEKPMIMLDAPVYRGNSGSPVIDETGNVVGIIFATLYDDSHGRVGVFIPIDYLYEAQEQ